MIGYPYIQSLFQAIIDVSQVMQGRFHVCPKWGSELNNANIDEIIIAALPKEQKYPCALLMPPRKTGNFQFSGAEVAGTQIGYNYYDIQMLFLRPAAYTAFNQVSQPAGSTGKSNTSTHTILETWHDMDRCAEAFMQVLHQVLMNEALTNGGTNVIISEDRPQSIVPVSSIANDAVSGVMLHFTLAMNGGCDIEDYPDDYLSRITVPTFVDTHPTHVNT